MSERYEWSESGKELLLAFELLIHSYGGNEKLADCIQKYETFDRLPGYTQWDHKTTLLMLKNINRMSISKLSALLCKSPSAIQKKVARLKEKGLITTSYSFSAKEFLNNNYYLSINKQLK